MIQVKKSEYFRFEKMEQVNKNYLVFIFTIPSV